MIRFLIKFRYLLAICVLFLGHLSMAMVWANAPTCGETYTIQPGDTLSGIASKVYQDSGKFNLIFYANRQLLTKGPAIIKVGQALKIPCLDSQSQTTAENNAGDVNDSVKPKQIVANEANRAVTAAANTASTADNTKNPERVGSPEERPQTSSTVLTENNDVFQLLTAGDYAPYTDQSLENGGLITEVVQRALNTVGFAHQIRWIDDWNAHLGTLLNERTYDAGFPWVKPECPSDSMRCEFLFSRPVFEVLNLLFVHTDRPIAFMKDDDVLGKTLCNPAGYETFSLERNGREWVSKKKIKLFTPQTTSECFYALERGDVDGVIMNDFTGRETVMRLGLQGKVVALPREISIVSLHVLIHKSHPKATIFLNQLNKGLEKLERSGEYETIASRHLVNHWNLLDQLQVKAQP